MSQKSSQATKASGNGSATPKAKTPPKPSSSATSSIKPSNTRSAHLTYKPPSTGQGRGAKTRKAQVKRKTKCAFNPASPRHMVAREREAKALELRKDGLSYREIGRELGMTEVGAYDVVMRVLQAYEQDIIEKVPAVRQLEVQRLDRDLKALASRRRAGDVRAIEAGLKVTHTRCRLLGLYAPEEVKHSGEITVLHSMTDAAIDLEMQTLLAAVPELRQLTMAVLTEAPQIVEVTGSPVPLNGHANGKA